MVSHALRKQAQRFGGLLLAVAIVVVGWLVFDRWLKPADAEEHKETRLAGWMNARYAFLIQRVTARPVLVMAGLVPLIVVAGFVAPRTEWGIQHAFALNRVAPSIER